MKLIFDRGTTVPNGTVSHDAFVLDCEASNVDYAVATEGECFARFTIPRSLMEERNPFTVTLRDNHVYIVDHFSGAGKEYALDPNGLIGGKPSPVKGITGLLRHAHNFVRRLPAYARGASTSMSSRAGRPSIFLDEDEATFYFGDIPAMTARRGDTTGDEDPVHSELHRLLLSETPDDLEGALRIRQYEVQAENKTVSTEDHEDAAHLSEWMTEIHRLIVEQEGRDRAATL